MVTVWMVVSGSTTDTVIHVYGPWPGTHVCAVEQGSGTDANCSMAGISGSAPSVTVPCAPAGATGLGNW